jgi:Rrf2 family protein
MRLSAAASYGLAAAAQLSHDKKLPPIPCSKLAEPGGLPDRFLLQICKQLVSANVFESVRGIRGGYRLARPASEISVADIVKAIDGPLVEKPAQVEGLTAASVRLVTTVVEQISRDVDARLSAVKLADLHATPARRPAKAAS